jgi:cytochrome c553
MSSRPVEQFVAVSPTASPASARVGPAVAWLAAATTCVAFTAGTPAFAATTGEAAVGTESVHDSASPPPARLAACQACHGVDGISTVDGAPNLAGQRASYLESQLTNFRSRERRHELMNAIASQLSDAEIGALATYWSSLPPAGTLARDARTAAAVASDVTFPRAFPEGFAAYRTSDDAESGTVTRDWANRAALEAARDGRPLPEEAVIVVETLAARTEAGRPVAGKPISYVVFAARAGWGDRIPELLRNANWQFGAFAPDRSPRLKNQATCLACHKPQAAKSFMFTYDELAEYARRR